MNKMQIKASKILCFVMAVVFLVGGTGSMITIPTSNAATLNQDHCPACGLWVGSNVVFVSCPQSYCNALAYRFTLYCGMSWCVPPLPHGPVVCFGTRCRMAALGLPHPLDNPYDIRNTRVNSAFGERLLNGAPNNHFGVDIQSTAGLSIRSLGQAVLINQGYDSTAGYTVTYRMTSVRCPYTQKLLIINIQHMEAPSPFTVIGSTISAREVVGRVGNTGMSSGAHLHIEIGNNDMNLGDDPFIGRTWMNRMNPLLFWAPPAAIGVVFVDNSTDGRTMFFNNF